jgi:hypothetical protein
MSRHKSLLIVVLAALAVTAIVPAGAQARRILRGPGYKTFVPSGWKVKHHHDAKGWRLDDTSPTGHSTDTLSVRVGTINAHKLAKLLGKKVLPPDPVELIALLPPVPTNGTNIQVIGRPQADTLGGNIAGTVGLHYEIKGQGYSATATVTQRGSRVYLLRIVGEDTQALMGQSAVAMVRSAWEWK